MEFIQILFWFLIFIILYSYVGYGILIFLLTRSQAVINLIPKPSNRIPQKFITENPDDYLPEVSLIISASGESEKILLEKIENTLQLNYPKNKMEIIFAIAYDTAVKEDTTLKVFYNT